VAWAAKLERRLEEAHDTAHMSAHGAETDIRALGGPHDVSRDPLGRVRELSGGAERHGADSPMAVPFEAPAPPDPVAGGVSLGAPSSGPRWRRTFSRLLPRLRQ